VPYRDWKALKSVYYHSWPVVTLCSNPSQAGHKCAGDEGMASIVGELFSDRKATTW
jgi:hypothetical protein